MSDEEACWIFLNQVAALVEARGIALIRLTRATLSVVIESSGKWRVTKPRQHFNVEDVYAMVDRDVRSPAAAADWIVDTANSWQNRAGRLNDDE